MLPICFIPCESMESPAAANTVTPASTRYLRKFTESLRLFHHRGTEHGEDEKKKRQVFSPCLCVSVVKALTTPWPTPRPLRRYASSPACCAGSAASGRS